MLSRWLRRRRPSLVTDSSGAEQVDEEKEARKAEQARLMLAGKSFLEDEDIFKGMTPQVG